MPYAEVVFGLPVDGPFDYALSENLSRKTTAGVRVWASFGSKKILGYVVNIKAKTKIKNLKSIPHFLDDTPILNRKMLRLTQELSSYYCCSWGQAIETALPLALRKGKVVRLLPESKTSQTQGLPEVTLLHSLIREERWRSYLEQIKETLKIGKTVIFLLPDIKLVNQASQLIRQELGFFPEILYRNQPQELDKWLKIREGRHRIVIGMRSAIFAPLPDLGLIIVDEEQDKSYKQEQVPHYHAREAAFMRANIEKAKLVLGSACPSLESFYLSKKGKMGYFSVSMQVNRQQVTVVDMKSLPLVDRKRNLILSRYLQDAVISMLDSGKKTLIFLNRKGFATFTKCYHCGAVLKCQRCQANLVYHFKDNCLACHYCNFKMPAPEICPNCNSNYIKYSGIGTEKIESELSRIFPQARIKRLEDSAGIKIQDADIFIATENIIRQPYKFDLVGVLSVDNYLNRVDFRSTEKTFALLNGLLVLAGDKFIVQTNLPQHYCFRALADRETGIFYGEELKQRRQLGFPPYRHMALIKIRGRSEEKAKKISADLFEALKNNNKNESVKIISVNPAYPAKLRGNFCWQITIVANNVKKICASLKKSLKSFAHSGIIITVDVDPL